MVVQVIPTALELIVATDLANLFIITRYRFSFSSFCIAVILFPYLLPICWLIVGSIFLMYTLDMVKKRYSLVNVLQMYISLYRTYGKLAKFIYILLIITTLQIHIEQQHEWQER